MSFSVRLLNLSLVFVTFFSIMAAAGQARLTDELNDSQAVSDSVKSQSVIYVPDDYPTIQSAIDAVEPNAVIVVFPGTYTENLDFNNKNVFLTTALLYDPDLVDAPYEIDDPNESRDVILNGDSDGSVVVFGGHETSDCVLQGFVIVNGYQLAAGGGVLGCGTGATIDQCVIMGNVASWGGGLCACNGLITNCLIAGNAAYYDGGGLAVCDGTITNCTIAGNLAMSNGGGLFDCLAIMSNSIVWDNYASGVGGIYAGVIPAYSCIQDWQDGGAGNISTNPLFYDADNGDFHLKSADGRWDPNDCAWKYDISSSPCIDAGAPERLTVVNDNGTPSDPNDDYEEEFPDPNACWTNELWPHGERINMGAYGGTPQGSMSGNPVGNLANLNHDEKVDVSDFLMFVDDWLLSRYLQDADLDRDGDIDYVDFGFFSAHWLSSVELLPPPVPTGLSLTADGFQVQLDWDDSAYEYLSGYNVYRAVNDANDLQLLIDGLTDSEYVDPNLSDGTEYFYAVTMETTFDVESDYSNIVSVAFSAPPAPTGLSITEGDEVLQLDWDDSDYVYFASYNLYRSTDPNTLTLFASGITESEFSDEAVEGGTEYYYAVTVVSLYDSESELSVPVSGCPMYEMSDTFETGFGNWSNISGEDTDDWIRNSGSTPSDYTGPSSGADGSTWYLYLEAGYAGSAGDTAILESPAIGGIDRQLSFYYHMYGADIGTLNVDVYSGGVWNEAIWNLSGEQQTSSTEAYRQAVVDLSAYTDTIMIRFRAVAAGGYRGDMAIDTVKISGVQ